MLPRTVQRFQAGCSFLKLMQIYINLKQTIYLYLLHIVQILLTYQYLPILASMKQIRAKVHQLTASGTKLSYQNTVTYLLDIVDILMAEPSPSKTKIHMKSPQSHARSQSSGKNRELKLLTPQEQHFDQDDRQEQQRNMGMAAMKQSQLSFVQELNNRIAQKKKEDQKKPIQVKKKLKFNRRGFQQSIEIYHQSLFESIEVIKAQHQKILELMKLTPKKLSNLEQFCQKYQLMKKQCKTFDDIIKITTEVLAKQLLTVLYPPKAITNPEKYINKPKNYLLYFQQ